MEFGAQDSYQLLFALDGAELKRLMEQVGGGEQAAATVGVGSNLAKLRAILDLARTLQSSFSIDEVLASVVDTALTITGAERGFLLLRPGDGRGTGDACRAEPARAELAGDGSAGAARSDPAGAGASPGTAVDELRAAGRGGDAAARTVSPTWNCAV